MTAKHKAPSLDADVLILGGGCAGLSLATSLAMRAPHLRVHILEARKSHTRDRTWCFWNAEPHPFEGGATHAWKSWRVRYAGHEARQRSQRYSYQHLPADNFYRIATSTIKQAGHVLSMGVDAQEAREHAGICEVDSSLGVLRSQWIFDSRPAGFHATKDAPMLLQRFMGWHVRTGRECFDPSVVDLMNFQLSEEAGRTIFFYVLPFSATEALVEATFFDDPAMPPACAEMALRRYMEALNPGGYEVLYVESASLPMGGIATSPRSRGGIVKIGTPGGRLKPSSGYAFLRIQRQSAAVANALATESRLPLRYEAPWYETLDRIFLRALKRSPSRAPAYFLQMFHQLPPDTLVRFLSETASPSEVLEVMLALPKLDFLRAAVSPTLAQRKALPA